MSCSTGVRLLLLVRILTVMAALTSVVDLRLLYISSVSYVLLVLWLFHFDVVVLAHRTTPFVG